MITTEKWETMDEIKARLGIKAEKVIAAVANEHRKGGNVCRFNGPRTEWRKK